MLEFVNVAQTVGTHLGVAVVSVVGTVAVFVKKWGPKIVRIDQAAVKTLEHYEKNAPAVEAVQDAQQAATTVDPQLRDALLNKTMREALNAFQIEAGAALGETYRDGIIQYVTSRVPEDMKPSVPQLLDATLQAIQAGNMAAMNHPAIQAVKTLKPAPVQATPVATPAPVV